MRKRYRKTVIAGETIERFQYASARKGLKIQVGPKTQETTAKQRKQNEKNATDRLRWLINANFTQGDWWVTLEYPARAKPTNEQIKANMEYFFKKLRPLYRRAGKELKYIMVAVRGKRGAVHIHLVLNFIEAQQIADAWRKIAGTKEAPYPVINFRPMDSRKNHADLAAYVIKNSSECYYDPARRIYGKRCCKSTNLQPPVIHVEEIKSKRWRKPQAFKGYYLDKNHIYIGQDEEGYPYQHYIMIREETRVAAQRECRAAKFGRRERDG